MPPAVLVEAAGAALGERNLALVGYRGCGKTTVGRILADWKRRPFYDTDDLVEQAAGRTVRDIFAQEGEAAFRAREVAALAPFAAAQGCILSVGGGAVLREENRAALAAGSVVVWLRAPAEVLLARLAADLRSAALRPALTDREPLDEIRHLLAEREPLYAGVARHILSTTDRSPEQVALDVLQALGRMPPTPDAS